MIGTETAQITVLGTSFNVKALQHEREIIVESGTVQVESGNAVIQANAGETIVAKDQNLRKELVKNELHSYYRTGKLVCNNTPLPVLIEKLNEIYNVNIHIQNPRLQKERINTVFHQQSLPEILEVIAETLEITYQSTSDTIVLR